MSGDNARRGFLFQDNYLLKRLLTAAAARLDELWLTSDRGNAAWHEQGLSRFGIEARSSADEAGAERRDWDVVIESSDKLELTEVKSGVLSRKDARTFWARLRREAPGAPTAARRLVPVLVVDPEKAGELLVKLTELSATVSNGPCVPPASEPEGNITDADKLVADAMWCLCGINEKFVGNPWAPEDARALLARLEIHRCPVAELEGEVNRLLGLFFANGLDEQQAAPLLGWLGQRAVTANAQRRYFTIHELLAEMGVLGLVSAFEGETLRAWRELWDGAGVAVDGRTKSRLGGSGESVTLAENQPEARTALTDVVAGPMILRGPGGAGKSVAVRQLVESARGESGAEVLWCGAVDLSVAEIEIVLRVCRFRASVLAWRAPEARLGVFVDALDEAEPGQLERWARGLARLGVLSNLRIVVSVREEAWRRVTLLDSQLGAWRTVLLAPWPEPLVSRLLANNPRFSQLSAGTREILRTPILLDLFWRTFVEGDANFGASHSTETRHGLMTAFWDERLLNARRHQQVRELDKRSLALWARSAEQVGSFAADNDVADVVEIAVSEGVLVRTGSFGRRLDFRHPLLRDFALAQWCLEAESAAGVAGRWSTITSGLGRRGVLRALAEALADDGAKEERPGLDLPSLVHGIATLGPQWAEELAQFLGAREARAEYDPARWPDAVQRGLPRSFGASLITSARLEGNMSWAHWLAGWSEESPWFDEVFPHELANYAESLAERVRRDVTVASLRGAAEQAARCLRRLADGRRFRDVFRNNDAWLCSHALNVVAGILPDTATFSWIERELEQATGRIRSRVLERVGDLAKANAARAALVYRQAVGLYKNGDDFRIRKENWHALMPQHVLDWTLGGEDRRIGLLREFPETFFPVAVDLIEALWRDGAQEHLNNEVSFASTSEVQATPSVVGAASAALLDDMPSWFHWHGYLGHGLREKALSIVHKAAREWAARDVERFVRTVAEPLRRSRMGSVQGIVLDVLEDHRARPEVAALRREAAQELRLYRIKALAYWSGRQLADFWPELPENFQSELLEFLRTEVARPEEYERSHGRYLLGRLTVLAWPEDLRAARPLEGDEDAREMKRPRWSMDREDGLEADEIPSGLNASDHTERVSPAPGHWPDGWDRAALDTFYRVTQGFGRANIPAAEKAAGLNEATQLALHFLANTDALREALQVEENGWFWDSLRELFELARGDDGGQNQCAMPAPLPALVYGCGELALTVADQIPDTLPGEMPERDIWSGIRETVWTRALRLADEALTWSPLRESEEARERFARTVERVFLQTDSSGLLQMSCVVRVRPWHWMRWSFGGEIGPWLVWRHASHPMTLRWALGSLLRYNDDECRVATLRCILARHFESSGDLADRLGEIVGVYAMIWYGDRRSIGADMPDEILDAPERFPLIAEPENWKRFWRGFMFGMKNQAQHTVRLHDLSFDYGRFALAAWRTLHPKASEVGDDSRGDVVLFALGWFDDAEIKMLDVGLLRPWWNELRPLLQSVAECGSQADCFSMFFNLRDKDYHHLVTVEEVLGWAEVLTRRFRLIDGQTELNLDERPVHGSGTTWRECLG